MLNGTRRCGDVSDENLVSPHSAEATEVKGIRRITEFQLAVVQASMAMDTKP